MRNKIITSFFCLLLAVSALIGLLMPDRYYSEREKRTLTQKPKFTVADFISGKFSDNLESYLTDQVPLRDDRVTLKPTWNWPWASGRAAASISAKIST